MRYYFDFAFLEELLKTEDVNEDILDDFSRRFLREIHGRQIFILLPDEKQQECLSNPLVRKIVDAGGRLSSKVELERDADDLTNTPLKFFFVNNTSVEDLKSSHGYFAVNSRSFEQAWSVVFPESVERTFGSEIRNWNYFREFALPINCLVFADRFFFGRDDATIDNLFPLLEALKIKRLTKRKVDILFIGRDFSKEDAFTNNHLENVFETLTNYFDNKLDAQGYNLTLIRVDGATIPNDKKFHFRLLATNNISLKPGKGFDQFNGKHVNPEPETMTIRLFLRSKTYEGLSSLLSPFKEAFEKTHDVFGNNHSGLRCRTKGAKTHSLINVVHNTRA